MTSPRFIGNCPKAVGRIVRHGLRCDQRIGGLRIEIAAHPLEDY